MLFGTSKLRARQIVIDFFFLVLFSSSKYIHSIADRLFLFVVLFYLAFWYNSPHRVHTYPRPTFVESAEGDEGTRGLTRWAQVATARERGRVPQRGGRKHEGKVVERAEHARGEGEDSDEFWPLECCEKRGWREDLRG